MTVNPLRLVGAGLALLAGGWAVTFLMVLREIPVDLPLALAAYGASVAGFGLGVVGAALWARSRRLR
jgi:hypothetical protein